ncbi:MAG: amino acid adenylation domain-containing protein, partial [Myxococcales bacterium]|nr:amino acid adenylation domain-containing protein [Myxococcales bacterium]
ARTSRASGAATRSLHRWFEVVAAAHPDAIAVVDGLDQLTYAELNQRANQLARMLVANGVKPGQLVGLCVERSSAIVIGELAILKAGAAYVPLDPALPTDRLAFYASDAALDVVVTQRALVGRLEGGQARAICLDEPFAQAGDNLAIERGAHDPAYVIYTSGSTGRPKGVVVSHHNVARLFTETERWFGFGSDDVWTLFHSYAFDFSVWEIWGALLYGGRVVIVSTAASQSPELLHQLLCSEGVTVLNQTPSAFQELSGVDARIRGGQLALRWIIFGGEALAPAMLQRWVERHGDQAPRLINMYGITETCVHVTYRPVTADDVAGRTASPIGVPIGDLDVYVLDEHLAPVPAGVPGELYVGGAGVALGYLHRAELTAARFIADPFRTGPGHRLYRTGDLARYSVARGELEYLGRIDSQVKIRGFRIELGEIEHALRARPEVRDAIVIAEADYLIAYVVPRHDAIVRTDDALASALRDAVASALPAYMVPTAVVVIERVPRNHNGKIDRAALPAWTGARGEVQDHEPPRGALEQRIAAIWTELLPVERVGRTDRFFHIGGHSLLATRMILRVREALSVELPILSIFETPMLADFALQVAGAVAGGLVDAASTSGEAAIPQVDRAVPAPLGLAQQRLWFLDRLDPGNPVYNVPMLFRLVGAVDAAALERSIERIAERHEVLRTSFPMVGDQPVQRIADATPYQLPISDLRGLPAAEREDRARAIARDELHQPFDLATGPAWRGRLVIGDDTTHWLVLCAHHIVLDGWSVNLYLAELAHHYRAAVEHRASELPPLATQYVDFCAWQRPWLDERRAAQLPFWRAQLADAPVV